MNSNELFLITEIYFYPLFGEPVNKSISLPTDCIEPVYLLHYVVINSPCFVSGGISSCISGLRSTAVCPCWFCMLSNCTCCGRDSTVNIASTTPSCC